MAGRPAPAAAATDPATDGVDVGRLLLVLVVQNDLGSALLLFGIFLGMLYIASGRALYVVFGLGSFALASWGAYAAFDRIGIRVQNWLDPWQDPLDTGFQQVQSDYALASGGLFGSGMGLGRPWSIPEVHTDFVFAAIGEELGILGTLGILALYLVLVMRGYAIALAARTASPSLLAAGLTTAIGLQVVIIVGGVIRLLPLTGITLPFVSYGGSSLLTNFLIVGLLLRISADRRPPRLPWRRFVASLRLLAAGGALGLVAVGLRSGNQITDARWLASSASPGCCGRR